MFDHFKNGENEGFKMEKEQEKMAEAHTHEGCPLAAACTTILEDVQSKLTREEAVSLIASKNLFCYLAQKDANLILEIFGTMAVNNGLMLPIYMSLVQMINGGEFKCARRLNSDGTEQEKAA